MTFERSTHFSCTILAVRSDMSPASACSLSFTANDSFVLLAASRASCWLYRLWSSVNLDSLYLGIISVSSLSWLSSLLSSVFCSHKRLRHCLQPISQQTGSRPLCSRSLSFWPNIDIDNSPLLLEEGHADISLLRSAEYACPHKTVRRHVCNQRRETPCPPFSSCLKGPSGTRTVPTSYVNNAIQTNLCGFIMADKTRAQWSEGGGKDDKISERQYNPRV